MNWAPAVTRSSGILVSSVLKSRRINIQPTVECLHLLFVFVCFSLQSQANPLFKVFKVIDGYLTSPGDLLLEILYRCDAVLCCRSTSKTATAVSEEFRSAGSEMDSSAQDCWLKRDVYFAIKLGLNFTINAIFSIYKKLYGLVMYSKLFPTWNMCNNAE